jgi:hypothetical protein
MIKDSCDTIPSVADILIEALHYIRRFYGMTIVIKSSLAPNGMQFCWNCLPTVELERR